MNATIYGRGQMVIPAKARRQAHLGEGDVVSVQPDGDERLILVRLEKPKPVPAKIRIIRRRGKHAVGVTEREVSSEEVQKFIDEFPWGICWTSARCWQRFGKLIRSMPERTRGSLGKNWPFVR